MTAQKAKARTEIDHRNVNDNEAPVDDNKTDRCMAIRYDSRPPLRQTRLGLSVLVDKAFSEQRVVVFIFSKRTLASSWGGLRQRGQVPISIEYRSNPRRSPPLNRPESDRSLSTRWGSSYAVFWICSINSPVFSMGSDSRFVGKPAIGKGLG